MVFNIQNCDYGNALQRPSKMCNAPTILLFVSQLHLLMMSMQQTCISVNNKQQQNRSCLSLTYMYDLIVDFDEASHSTVLMTEDVEFHSNSIGDNRQSA